MCWIGKTTIVALTAALLGITGAHAQTPGTDRPTLPSTQPRDNPSDTTPAAPRSRQDPAPDNVVPADGATDRAPPSKLQPGPLPPPQNPKGQ